MPNTTHLPLDRALKRLGANISLARRRRHWSQKELAERMSTSVSTVRRLEIGDPGVRLTSLASALHALGEIGQFNALLDTRTDTLGLISQDDALPKRIRAKAPAVGVRV
jgi:transcriptional regulator with XRE-family HTH domain